MNRRDWLLAAIALSGERGLSPIQIQKAMFLLRMEAPDAVGRQFYAFIPYDYGPFSSSIYRDLDQLVVSGLVREKSASTNYSGYYSTEFGRQRLEPLFAEVPDDVKQYLADIVRWILSVGFTQLLRSIYAKYPDYAQNSVFRY